jgi:AcrR family transcriptional regulator
MGGNVLTDAPEPPKRSTYRHGDLRRALIDAGIELARVGGPDAVILREATRRAGVVPNAAYRHFEDRHALLEAVCETAIGQLAVAIENELSSVPDDLDPAPRSRAKLRAVGAGYLRYAQAEPGLFKTAFSLHETADDPPTELMLGRSGLSPFGLLNQVLDEMVATGALSPERRPGAEIVAWSAVHGLAFLINDGPLRSLDQHSIRAVTTRLLAMVDQGL